MVSTYKRYYDLYKQFEFLGLGPTCSTRSVVKLAELIVTFNSISHTRFHVFGPNVRAVKMALEKSRCEKWYSFDSGAFYWIGNKMVSKPNERFAALANYMKKLEGVGGVELPKLYR